MGDDRDSGQRFDDERLEQAATTLKAIGSRPRLEILCWLMTEPNTERSVTELQEGLGYISQSSISQHLARLRAAEIVKTRRVNQTIYYSLKDERVATLIRTFMGPLSRD